MNKFSLDQFYTKTNVCNKLIELIFKKFKISINSNFLEPSSGSGNFIKSLLNIGVNENNIKSIDLEPKFKNTLKANYLETKIEIDNLIIIGNPPFGKNGKTALEFLNKALSESNFVAFILPNTFKRFSMQNKIDKEARLIYSLDLEPDSFTFNDKNYSINCVFQIWTKNIEYDFDYRILSKPPIVHEDFKTFIYNNTANTYKYFNKSDFKWDFAVVRQGWYDYSNKITSETDLLKNRQYFFVRYLNKCSKDIIDLIDFNELSKSNTITPGFSTSDFVQKYIEIKNSLKNKNYEPTLKKGLIHEYFNVNS